MQIGAVNHLARDAAAIRDALVGNAIGVVADTAAYYLPLSSPFAAALQTNRHRSSVLSRVWDGTAKRSLRRVTTLLITEGGRQPAHRMRRTV